jgi:NagD protein
VTAGGCAPVPVPHQQFQADAARFSAEAGADGAERAGGAFLYLGDGDGAFLHSQKPNGPAFVIGEAGLSHALYQIGYSLTEVDPDYVVLGDTPSYDYAKIDRAVRLILGGGRFIATNPDVSGPEEEGIHPACGALAAPIERVTGREAYFVGKPNPLMMREALRRLEAHSENAIMIGDRMDTDILSGLGAGMQTVLVLTGVTAREELSRYSYQPHRVVDSLADLTPE